MIRKIKKEDAQSIQEICDISLGYTVSTELVENQIIKLSADKKHHVIYEMRTISECEVEKIDESFRNGFSTKIN